MTILKRIKDYIDRRGHLHYHFEKVNENTHQEEEEIPSLNRPNYIPLDEFIDNIQEIDIKRLEEKV